MLDADAADEVAHRREGILRFFQVNCRSLGNKVLEFQSLVEIHGPDVVICTETWLKEEISDSEIFPRSYHKFRRDRINKGGGVCICVKKDLECNVKRVDRD